jgi:hypothetical protein
MSSRKLIVIDKENDALLGAICSAALKISGMEILDDVNALINSIKEESVDQMNFSFDK